MSSSPIIEKVWTPLVADLIDRLKRLDSAGQYAAPYFVFKVNKDLLDNLSHDEPSREQIVSRYPNKKVYLLVYDRDSVTHNIYLVQEDRLQLIVDPQLLSAIRQFDLLQIINEASRDCVIHAPTGSHFITPSKKHTAKFLRLADALHSYDALDRLSYWLQSEMRGASAIVIDTWSLASVVLASQLLFDGQEKVPFDCFHRHIKNDEDEAERIVGKLAKRLKGDGPLICLVSVSSSGSFFEVFERIARRSNIENEIKMLSIYRFQDSAQKIQSLATLDFSLGWFDESNCKYCNDPQTKTTFEIDPKFYYPRQHKEIALKIRKKLLQEKDSNEKSSASKFIHKYGKFPGVLRVHRDDPNDGANPRHHAFYIDIKSLLDQPTFMEELSSALAKIKSEGDRSILVVAPPHSAGKLLAAIAGEHLGARFICHQNLRGLQEADRQLVFAAEHIIIIDDVLISGNRVLQYLAALREEFDEEKLRQSLRKVTWFPLLARPSRDGDITAIRDALTNHSWSNQLTYLYEVVLPQWADGKDCPWCQEAVILEKMVESSFDEPTWYKSRRNLLTYGKEEGISDEPLLLLPGVARKTSGGNSPLADEGSNEMQVIFLFAAALQRMRNDKTQGLGNGLFQNNVLEMFDATENDANAFKRFSEALFQAALLRTVRCEEWSQSVKSRGVNEIANLVASGTSDILIAETILFLHRIRFDKALPEELSNALRRLNMDEVVKSLISRFSV